MVILVKKLLEEIADCKLDYHHLSIDPRVMTISPEDIKAEEGLFQRIGSTKTGVGAATARRITDRVRIRSSWRGRSRIVTLHSSYL